jgi:hypothetical protein
VTGSGLSECADFVDHEPREHEADLEQAGAPEHEKVAVHHR